MDSATIAPEAGSSTGLRGRASMTGVLTLLLALLAIGTAGAAAPAVDWSDCGDALQCAHVRVPLDWGKPSGRKITLSVARHLASDPDQRIGSLFINPGGPGTSGVNAVITGGGGFDSVYKGRFDIVSWDLRGSAASTHVSCFASQGARDAFWGDAKTPITSAQSRQYLPKTIGFAHRCGQRNRALLPHISTTDSARDLNYLRRLVGDRQLTFYGASAGTLLGQTYLGLYPRRVRAMILDGVIDPPANLRSTESFIARGRRDTDLAFEKFEATCENAGPGLCALAGKGPVAARVQGLIDRLRQGPVPAPTATPPGEATYSDFLTASFQAMDHPAQWPGLATALDQAADGDGSALATVGLAGIGDAHTMAFEGTEGIGCADSPASHPAQAWPTVIPALTRVSSLSGPGYGWTIWAPCASWPARAADRYTGPWNINTKSPILVQDTVFDPSTPFANARRVSQRLGNAVLLTENGYGHLTTSDISRCILSADSAYMVDLVTPPAGTVCEADRQPFDPDFGKPMS